MDNLDDVHVNYEMVRQSRPEVCEAIPSTFLDDGSPKLAKDESMILSNTFNTGKAHDSLQSFYRPSQIRVFIKSLKDTTSSIQIDSNFTIKDLKLLIFERESISPPIQRLVHGCRGYSNELRLSDLSMAGETITLLLRLYGGGKRQILSSNAAVEDNPKIMPVMWWFGYGRSYQDGRTGDGGRCYHVLKDFVFGGPMPKKWYSSSPMAHWEGITLVLSEDRVIQGIRMIDLESFELKLIPELIGNLTSLVKLYVRHNQLLSLPDSIGDITSLTHLSVSHNQLSSLPESIGNMTSLTDLYAYCNQLLSLPESFGSLKSLTELHVSNNKLSSLPESIGNLRSLKRLNTSINQLLSLPESIGNMTSLTELNVSINQLSLLPESIGNLRSLIKLYARRNQLLSLPDSIGDMISLDGLYLSSNQLLSLPETIGNMTSLTWLAVDNNPITSNNEGKNEVRRRFYRPGLCVC